MVLWKHYWGELDGILCKGRLTVVRMNLGFLPGIVLMAALPSLHWEKDLWFHDISGRVSQ